MRMSRTEIIEKLHEILEFTLGQDPSFDESSRLIDDLGFSSVDMLYMMIAAEESFGIRFENIGIMDIKTVGAAVDYIEAQLK